MAIIPMNKSSSGGSTVISDIDPDTEIFILSYVQVASSYATYVVTRLTNFPNNIPVDHEDAVPSTAYFLFKTAKTEALGSITFQLVSQHRLDITFSRKTYAAQNLVDWGTNRSALPKFVFNAGETLSLTNAYLYCNSHNSIAFFVEG